MEKEFFILKMEIFMKVVIKMVLEISDIHLNRAVAYQEIQEQTARALEELLNASQLKRGDIFIVGCSTSEVMGQRIGKGSSLDAAKAVYEGLYPALHERGIFLAAQCCEHLNRAVIVERAALLPGTEICNVVPQLHAGGAFAMTVYQNAADPVAVESALGYRSSAVYDYHFGKPVKTTDINGNEIWYRYDLLGRMTRVTAPYEQGNQDPYTIRMEYHPHHYGAADVSTNAQNPYSYAVTRHYDPQHPGNDIVTTVISDGLGRMLQTKKDAEIGGQEVSLVTGKVVYDCFGRTVAQYHPFTEDTVQYALYNDSVTSGTATVTEYDILDRQTRVTLPLNSIETTFR